MTDDIRTPPSPDSDRPLDAIVVGAGFAGLYMLHRLREAGCSARILEAASGVGGTWFWNRYPGARCDVESMEYSYSFSDDLQQEWVWPERYGTQPEILRYLEHVAQRFDLLGDIRFDTRVTSAVWDQASDCWLIGTDAGESYTARCCVMATGNLSVPKLPDWPGMEGFEGRVYHTGNWPRTPVDLAGRRVAVVGTGSSGIQVIPQIARAAGAVVVFQRMPNFAVPANNRPLDEERQREVRARYDTLREQARNSFLGFFNPGSARSAIADDDEQRRQVFEESWAVGGPALLLSYGDLLVDEQANAAAADFVRSKIRALIADPASAEKMVPHGYPIGARRLCIEIGYYDAINQAHVTLVDVRASPVVEVTAGAIRTATATFDIDALVLATGFHAMVGALDRIDVRGRDGRSLKAEWQDGPRAYLGLMTEGFPNLFMITGPGSPSVLSNMVVSIEQHVEWIVDCLAALRSNGDAVIEPLAEAEDAWMEHVDAVAQGTLFPRAESWYHGKTRAGRKVFMPYVGGVGSYRQHADAIAKAGYEGFTTRPQRAGSNDATAEMRHG